MRIWYDCEFLDTGKTIELISIGLVRDDGAEYYAVNADIDTWLHEGSRDLHDLIAGHDWLMRNVVPHLPVISAPTRFENGTWLWSLNRRATEVKPKWVIANEVRDFIQAAPEPQLWAWYAAYDHVALAQLWGPMARLPDRVPMYTNDLKQECDRLGNPDLPPLPDTVEHHALSDAREVKMRHEYLVHYAAGGNHLGLA
jgi:hypothetical protein